jgi:amino-acid N-acetyltransferase
VENRLAAAAERNLAAVYLLTTTAAPFFRRLGFVNTSREDAPIEVRASSEFSTVCPSTAECLSISHPHFPHSPRNEDRRSE